MRGLPLLLLLLACTPTTTTSHYRIPLPHPHGYHVGQVLALFAPLPNIPDPQPLGIARISRIDDAHLELTPIWLDPRHNVPPTFEIRDVPPAAFVVLAQDRVVVAPWMRILLTDFGGDQGPPYAAALRDALATALGDMPEIMLETTSLVIENAEQAEQVGRDAGVDLVMWGSASSLGEGLVIQPELTWLGEVPSSTCTSSGR